MAKSDMPSRICKGDKARFKDSLTAKKYRAFGLGPAFAWTWKILQWPIAFALVVIGLGFIYYFAPDAEQAWVWITPGTLVATLLWLVGSLAFRYYVLNFTDYEATYGAVGGVILLGLLFLFMRKKPAAAAAVAAAGPGMVAGPPRARFRTMGRTRAVTLDRPPASPSRGTRPSSPNWARRTPSRWP